MGIRSRMKALIYDFIKTCKKKELYPIPTPINTNALLENKVALISGGSGGIGFAIAESFLNSGARVIISGTSDEKLVRCVKKLEETHEGRIGYVNINLKDIISMQSAVSSAVSIFGHIDILVNSAGLASHHSFIDIAEDEYDAIMDVNAKGTFFLSQTIAKYWIKNEMKGHILNISSSSALRPAWTPYQMSKWAVRGLTLGMADLLLPYGIIVNAIAPGPVATAMYGKTEGESIAMELQPSGRFAMPSEIANLAVIMASDMAQLVVGDTLYATGGSGNLSYRY